MKRICGVVSIAALTVLTGLLGACSSERAPFSMRPAFVTHFETYPPTLELPDERHRALLNRFRPRLFLPAGHAGLIDFYADYVEPGKLYAGDGRLLAAAPTAGKLREHREDPTVWLDPGAGSSSSGAALPPAYARAVPLWLGPELDGRNQPDGARSEHLLLQYHFVFRVSGLPAGIKPWQGWLLGVIAELDDWHQLDHYTAVNLILDEETLTPVLLVLQQHNYQRTYLLGEHIQMPADGRLPIDVADRSNELYPHHAGRRVHRAVRFLSPEAMTYMLSGESRPFMSADDITRPAAEVDYRLAYLPGDDPFYLFKGTLGERRWLPGRSGPPGAEFNTLPAHKPWSVAISLGYWRDDDEGDIGRWRLARTAADPALAFAALQRPVLLRNLACIARAEKDCPDLAGR